MTERVQCLALVIDGLMRIIEAQGGTSMITLSPPPLQRTAKMVCAEAHRISRTYVCDLDGREYAVFETKVARAIHRLVALGIDVETLEADGRHCARLSDTEPLKRRKQSASAQAECTQIACQT